ncbi:MAG: dihydroorotase [Verrucomicrobiales bacterium]|nr:dihydroorotase [Verrucomicrobiales bacterium]|tara:strand:- start:1204 stop:2568 length:1365 start_codon:yes stop_codon:yes gene_type:complete
MGSLHLRGGRVIDPANRFDSVADVLISEGRVAEVGEQISQAIPDGCKSIDCSGKVVAPGLIDMHVHLREPGQSAKETIETGTRAAVRGGFTSVVCMPNTSPAIDSAGTVALVKEKAEKQALVNVYITGAITKDIAGEEMAPIGSLKQAGVVAITDGRNCVQSHELMRRAMEYAAMFGLPVIDHCQDESLVTDGVAHEGYWSAVLGLHPWPAAGEEMIVARNVLLAEKTGCRVHCQHVSAAGSVRLIREAKSRGVPISGEACPHHFVLTDAALAGSEKFWEADGKGVAGYGDRKELPSWPKYDTLLKMNPPIRSAADREAILDGLTDGTLEVLASDHAPHCDYEKEVEFDYAPFGVTGLETALSLSLMQLCHSGRLGIDKVIEKFTSAPAKLLKLDRGSLSVGAVADVTVINPDVEWTFTAEETASKSVNSPFNNWPLKGRAVSTIVGGRVVNAE